MPQKGEYSANASARSVYQRKYNGKPEQLKRRAQRNAARAAAEKIHGKKALQGKDVDHVKAGKKGNLPNKTRIRSIHANRSEGGRKAHS